MAHNTKTAVARGDCRFCVRGAKEDSGSAVPGIDEAQGFPCDLRQAVDGFHVGGLSVLHLIPREESGNVEGNFFPVGAFQPADPLRQLPHFRFAVVFPRDQGRQLHVTASGRSLDEGQNLASAIMVPGNWTTGLKKNREHGIMRLSKGRSATKEPTEPQRLLKEEVMGRIDYWHTELPAMGSRKIAAMLREEGYQVGRKLVRSYMREMAIYAVYPKPNLSKNDGKAGMYLVL